MTKHEIKIASNVILSGTFVLKQIICSVGMSVKGKKKSGFLGVRWIYSCPEQFDIFAFKTIGS